MARIPLPDPDDPGADPEARAALAALRERRQMPALRNVQRAMANHPQAMEQFYALADTVYFRNSLPTARLRELPYLTSAVANQCFY